MAEYTTWENDLGLLRWELRSSNGDLIATVDPDQKEKAGSPRKWVVFDSRGNEVARRAHLVDAQTAAHGLIHMSKLRVAVLGSGGIIGQHLHISVPGDIEPLFVRKHPFPLATALDLEDWDATKAWLDEQRPDVIINLAGESRPDVVERDPNGTGLINEILPGELCRWCDKNDSHLVQVSTQAVFSGESGPYTPDSLARFAVNEYGRQKHKAEHDLQMVCSNWTIVRPTFVLGIRPFPALGRENPAEAILGRAQPWQVDNRWFSVSFAWDVAEMLWQMARLRPKGRIVHCGNPERLSRYELARRLNSSWHFTPISHEALGGIFPDAKFAERPRDTTFKDAYFETSLEVGLEALRRQYASRAEDRLGYRAQELAAFLRLRWPEVAGRLSTGFTELHNATSDDFRKYFGPDPQPDSKGLLNWYRQTEAYLWELTAYHCDPGFNYAGMCAGIVATLKEDAVKECGQLPDGDPESYYYYRVLCLGDGVGSLTIALKQASFEPVYHDLTGSVTGAFALNRFRMRFADDIFVHGGPTFAPPDFDIDYDAVVSLDFLEHVPNVEEWVRAAFAALKPGGLLCAVNRFECGSAGEIPMHLAVNDHYVTEWEPLLKRVGFEQVFADDGPAPDWHRKPL